MSTTLFTRRRKVGHRSMMKGFDPILSGAVVALLIIGAL